MSAIKYSESRNDIQKLGNRRLMVTQEMAPFKKREDDGIPIEWQNNIVTNAVGVVKMEPTSYSGTDPFRLSRKKAVTAILILDFYLLCH